jgi:F-type H+-transporting ATPase subunit epsilon
MDSFQIAIIAADRDFYEGVCESLVVPTTDGQLGILAHHSNLIEAIVPGKLTYTVPGEEPKIAFVSSGMLKVEENEVLVLVDSAERPEEIDESRARHAEAKAREALLQKQSRQEYITSKAHLARAMNRLKVRHDYDVKL